MSLTLSEEAKELKRQYEREWRAKHREACNQYSREWRRKHKDKVKEYNQRYWEKKAKELEGAENGE